MKNSIDLHHSPENPGALSTLLFRALIFGLCSYGLLYYAYKFYQPKLSGTDYFQCFKMYLDPFENDARDPFRTRKLSSLVTHAIYRSGLYYRNIIAYEQSVATQKVRASATARSRSWCAPSHSVSM